MRVIRARCRHCAVTYSLQTSGHPSPQFGHDDRYCLDCARVIEKALSRVERRVEVAWVDVTDERTIDAVMAAHRARQENPPRLRFAERPAVSPALRSAWCRSLMERGWTAEDADAHVEVAYAEALNEWDKSGLPMRSAGCGLSSVGADGTLQLSSRTYHVRMDHLTYALQLDAEGRALSVELKVGRAASGDEPWSDLPDEVEASAEAAWETWLAELAAAFHANERWADKIDFALFARFLVAVPTAPGQVVARIPGSVKVSDLEALHDLESTTKCITIDALWGVEEEYVEVLIKVDSPGLERSLKVHGPVLAAITEYARGRGGRVYFV